MNAFIVSVYTSIPSTDPLEASTPPANLVLGQICNEIVTILCKPRSQATPPQGSVASVDIYKIKLIHNKIKNKNKTNARLYIDISSLKPGEGQL